MAALPAAAWIGRHYGLLVAGLSVRPTIRLYKRSVSRCLGDSSDQQRVVLRLVEVLFDYGLHWSERAVLLGTVSKCF